jgi:hypothetical protein
MHQGRLYLLSESIDAPGGRHSISFFSFFSCATKSDPTMLEPTQQQTPFVKTATANKASRQSNPWNKNQQE